MVRWIAFDEESAAFTARYCKTAVHFHRANALDFVLENKNAAVLVFPSHEQQKLNIVTVRHCSASGEFPAYRPTGVLGLTDIAVFQDEPVEDRKWWHRLLKRGGVTSESE